MHKQSVEVSQLMTLLENTLVGTIAAYSAMKEVTGRDPQKVRWPATSAMRKLAKRGIIFAAVRNEGYRRLPNKQIHEVGDNKFRSARRQFKRLGTALSAAYAQANDLLDPERRTLHQQISRAGMVSMICDPRTGRKLETKTETQPLAPHACMQLLLGD